MQTNLQTSDNGTGKSDIWKYWSILSVSGIAFLATGGKNVWTKQDIKLLKQR
jgi:hypothetical protein